MADASWDSAALAHAVCDKLVERGVLKEKPAFIRTDREAKIAKVFEVAKLDGASLLGMTGRAVEVAVRNATEGEAWVDDVQRALKGLLDPEAAAKTDGVVESEEMKQLREKMVENAKLEFADGKVPDAHGGPTGRRVADRGPMNSEQYSSFGGRGGGMGGGEARPGDWTCPSCHSNVFASKMSCFRCNEPKPEGVEYDDSYSSFSSRGRDRDGYGGGGYGGGYGGGGDSRPGDWTCPSCSANVFASKNSCFRCNTPRPDDGYY